MKKKVAIITRTKDRPLMLPRVRRSVERQTFKDFIWVLVNDAGISEPVDATADMARNNGVDTTVVHRSSSTGMEGASNDGISHSESEYIVVHDDDDTWEPEFLMKMVQFLDDNPQFGSAICHTAKIIESISGSEIVETKRLPYNDWIEAVHMADMLVCNTYSPISFLFRRSLYDQLGSFDETLPVLGDWDFNLRALLKSDIGVLPVMLANYHFRENTDVVDAYGNSLNAGIDKHVAFDAIYRHRKLRQDIDNNSIGLGFLLQQGRMLQNLNAKLSVLVRFKDLGKRILGKVGLRSLISRSER